MRGVEVARRRDRPAVERRTARAEDDGREIGTVLEIQCAGAQS